ncbi:MAG: protein kinase [Candidatus Contendobacter sp.]|nr:protein kinase [Candidatus Contendobacter sp.]MDS4060683.1 protein kinase [Candidatus Contendobacter sp.]
MALQKTRKMLEESDEQEPFELISLLGMGGFAQTYKARVLEEELKEEFGSDIVALKIPLDRQKERVLRRELEMNAILHVRLRKIQSVNLVRYLGFAVFRNSIVMVMQFVSGGNLRKILGKIGAQKPLPIDQAIRITEGVLSGLVILHKEQIFHRDIKPENILLDGDTPMIADLGISRMLDSGEIAITTAGTPYYMSPEIWRGGASFPSDIWSLGVTFYEMVTGHLPFGGGGRIADGGEMPIGRILEEICRAEPIPPKELRPDLPQSLNDFILRSLQRDSSQRGTAEEMLDALRTARGHSTDDEIEHELGSIRVQISAMKSPADVADIEERLKELLEKCPNQPRIHQHLGEFYNRCQRYPEAIAVFEKGIQTNPDNALLHWDLALALQRKGQKKNAARHLELAMVLGLDASLHRHASILLKVLQGG